MCFTVLTCCIFAQEGPEGQAQITVQADELPVPVIQFLTSEPVAAAVSGSLQPAVHQGEEFVIMEIVDEGEAELGSQTQISESGYMTLGEAQFTESTTDVAAVGENATNVVTVKEDTVETLGETTRIENVQIGENHNDVQLEQKAVPLKTLTGDKLHLCTVCHVAFTSKVEFDQHISAAHQEQDQYQCSACQDVFESQTALNQHEQKHGAGAKPFSCKFCKKGFFRRRTLTAHLRAHKKKFPGHECKKCAQFLPTQEALEEHLENHYTEDPYKCAFCVEAYKGKASLVRHLNSHVETPHECTVCGKAYASKLRLEIHELLHSDEKSNQCRVCRKVFSGEHELELHLLWHERTKCHLCGVQFHSSEELDTHLLGHTEDTPHRCTYCQKNFTASESLQEHQLSHIEELIAKPFTCDICGMAFNAKWALQSHFNNTHTSEDMRGKRTFKCSICDEVFSSAWSRGKHQLTHPGFGFPCPVCQHVFIKKKKLIDHMVVHTKEKRYQCPLCYKAVTLLDTIKGHMELKHPAVKTYMCRFCQEKLTCGAYEFAKHLRSHHEASRIFDRTPSSPAWKHLFVTEENFANQDSREYEQFQTGFVPGANNVPESDDFIQDGHQVESGKRSHRIRWQNVQLQSGGTAARVIAAQKILKRDVSSATSNAAMPPNKPSDVVAPVGSMLGAKMRSEWQMQTGAGVPIGSDSAQGQMIAPQQPQQEMSLRLGSKSQIQTDAVPTRQNSEREKMIAAQQPQEEVQLRGESEVQAVAGLNSVQGQLLATQHVVPQQEVQLNVQFLDQSTHGEQNQESQQASQPEEQQEENVDQQELGERVAQQGDDTEQSQLTISQRTQEGQPELSMDQETNEGQPLNVSQQELSEDQEETNGAQFVVEQESNAGEQDVEEEMDQSTDVNTPAAVEAPELYQCGECNKLFPNRDSAERHMSTHVFETFFQCEACNETFAQESLLRQHYLDRHVDTEKPELCTVCFKPCKDAAALEDHMTMHTAGKPFHCQVCHKGFSQKSYLKDHMWSHTQKGPFDCSECHKSFRRRRALEDHLLSHRGEKPYKCQVCGKTYRQEYDLKRHRFLHTGERPFQCTKCDEAFIRKDFLRQHYITVHDGGTADDLAKYQCDICGKVYRKEYSVRMHRMAHTGERPHECNICGMKFIRKDAMERHSLRHAVDRERTFKCSICDKSFFSKSNLKNHQLTHSIGQRRQYECELCGKTLSALKYLNKHMTACH